jgi:hypothetical protein
MQNTYITAFAAKRCFIGTNSPVMKANDCCPEAPNPIKVVPPIIAPILWAVAQTIHPMSAIAAEPMKNHYAVCENWL